MPHYSINEFHGAVTHFPIAMLIAAVLFEIGAALFGKPEWRVVSFWLLVTAVVGAIPSLISGWITGNQFYGEVPNPPDIFIRHRLAAFITSGLAVILLIWRIVAKDKLAGGALGLSIVVAVAAAAGVSYTGYLGGCMTMGGCQSTAPTAPAAQPSKSTASTVTPVDPQLIVRGKLVYSQNNCSTCHKIDHAGGAGGPDLTHEGARNADVQWQIAHLQNPAKTRPGSFMPAYNKLPASDLNALAQYLVSLK